MARLLLPLLLLCSAHTATASPQHMECGVFRQATSPTPAVKCKVPPCNITTTDAITLTLPVLLSVEDPRQAVEEGSTWGTRLFFLDNTRVVLGEVKLSWDKERSEVVLTSTTCGGKLVTESFPAALQAEDSWLHLQVEMEGRQVTLSHLNATMKVMFKVNPAPTVTVVSSSKLGYSAIGIGKSRNNMTSEIIISVAAGVAVLLVLGALLIVRLCSAHTASTANLTTTTTTMPVSVPSLPAALVPQRHDVLWSGRLHSLQRPFPEEPQPHCNKNYLHLGTNLTRPQIPCAFTQLHSPCTSVQQPRTPVQRHKSVNSLYGMDMTGVILPQPQTPLYRHNSVNSLYGMDMTGVKLSQPQTPLYRHNSVNSLYGMDMTGVKLSQPQTPLYRHNSVNSLYGMDMTGVKLPQP